MERNKFDLLSHIKYPEDLRKLTVEQLPEVCRELRADIVDELSVNPGHLASSLGAVEITVALHYVFNTPQDRIVWDVGHQAYAHKILTGRRDTFCTNRKLNGVRPFPTPQESEYDAFICGHASNSISAALGMAVASMQKKRKNTTVTPEKNTTETTDSDASHSQKETEDNFPNHVVAVIGDGAMSGGLAFEGLNNVSQIPNDMLIILNDNNMSIDRSVGGMKQYLLSLNTNETYNNLRYKISRWLNRRGMMNDDRRQGLIRLNNAIKAAISHQQNIFEGMNIRYFGPFDGHNVVEIVRLLRHLKDMKGPKLLHLHTIKGKGYKPAEQSQTVWHAPGKFNVNTGERIKPQTTDCPPKFQYVFGETLLELARKNPRIIGITPAMPSGCSMNIMMKAMPDRAFDVGIAEGHAVTFSAGLAKEGLQPFCNIYSSFAQRAYDNIIHDAAILNLPVVICLDRAGIVGEDGPTHHGAFDLAYLRPIPNVTIASPFDERELRRLMFTAQLPGKGVFVIRYPRGNGTLTDWKCPFEEVEVGTGRKLRDGTDVAVLSIGPIGTNVTKAIKELKDEGATISVAHYDMRFLKPLDETILKEIGNKFNRIITIEDGIRNGGLGSAVTEWMSDNGYHPRITRMGLPDEFVEHGTVAELQHIVGIDTESIKKEITI